MKFHTTRFYPIAILVGWLCLLLLPHRIKCQNPLLNDSLRPSIRIPFLNHPSSLPYFLKLRKAGLRYKTTRKSVKASAPPVKKIVGWHPYWFNTSYFNYQYDVLTHVIYFGADITVSGSPHVNFNGWDTTGLVKYTRQNSKTCKVYLNVFCASSDMSSFLKNPSYYSSVINTLVTSVLNHEADGLCLDFEGGPSGLGSYFTNFVSDLKKACDEAGLQLCIALPAINGYGLIESAKLTPLVDFFVIMGYDYFGSFSSISGPIAPLINTSWIYSSVDESVQYYKTQNIPDSMLCLGVPYFGAIWETQSKSIPATIENFIGYRPFSYAAENNTTFLNDTALKASYLIYTTKEDSVTNRQFWMDTYYSLGAKYDYALSQNLAGVGIWALGYDEGTDTLWQLLREKFTPAPPKDTTDTLKGKPLSLLNTIKLKLLPTLLKHRYMFGLTLFILFTAFFCALVNVLNSAGAIPKLKTQKLLAPVLIAAIALLYGLCIALFYICLSNRDYYLMAGIGLSTCICMGSFVYYWYKKRNAEMP